MVGSLFYVGSAFLVLFPVSLQSILLNTRQLWNWKWYVAIVAFNSHFGLVYLIFFLRQNNAQTAYGKLVQRVIALILCCGCVVPFPEAP